jgi:hypothetical protein
MRTRREVVFALLLAFVGYRDCFAQDAGTKVGGQDVDSTIAGTWRGGSTCLVKGSACRDEVNVYRFSKLAQRPGLFSVTASKVADGKEIVMGRGDWTYDAGKHVLECKSPEIRMVVDGNRMQGDLTLPDGTAYRRISLKKEE